LKKICAIIYTQFDTKVFFEFFEVSRKKLLGLQNQPSCRRTAYVPDSDPREFGLNSKKQAFSLTPVFCNSAEIAKMYGKRCPICAVCPIKIATLILKIEKTKEKE
jgi:hypothetical protein